MGKVKKTIPPQQSNQPESGQRRVLVFCTDNSVAKQIVDQLSKKNFLVWHVDDERKLLTQLDHVDPELILMQINALLTRSFETIVAEVFLWMRARARAINKFLDTPSQYLWQHSRIILFKSETQITPTGSLMADIADDDELVRVCSLLGDVKYIGTYSFFSFIPKIRFLIENFYE